MSETKREKFVRLAEKRMDNALKSISLVENLANPNVYEYSKEDSNKIVKALKDAVAELERSYNSTDKPKKFKLN